MKVLLPFAVLFFAFSAVQAQEALKPDQWGLPVEENEFIKKTRFWSYVSCDTRTPIFVVYQLDFADTRGYADRRKSQWHKEEAAACPLAIWDDYKKLYKLGYNSGHLCPAGSSHSSQDVMDETFSHANRAPQDIEFNQGVWRDIEHEVRGIAKAHGDKGILVFTGIAFEPDREVVKVGTGVAIPHYFWKVIATTGENEQGIHLLAWLCPNRFRVEDRPDQFLASIDQIEALTGLDFFALLEDTVENQVEARTNRTFPGKEALKK